jgi:uracil-DNA glycosylase
MIKVVKGIRRSPFIILCVTLLIGVILGAGLYILVSSSKYSPKYDNLTLIPFTFCVGMIFLFEDVLELECGFYFGIMTSSIIITLLIAGALFSRRKWRNLKWVALGLVVYVVLSYLIITTFGVLLHQSRRAGSASSNTVIAVPTPQEPNEKRRPGMRMDKQVKCTELPCVDVRHERFVVPNVDINPADVSIVMISEAAPANTADYYYARGNPLFARTTMQAFWDAGADISGIQDILDLGVYLTTAVKCGKTGCGIKAGTINQCSHLLEQELALFPNAKIYMLMGDVAIKALNYVAKRQSEPRVIPAGSTYKIRGREYYFKGSRVFPSYLQAGPSFGIEKSKRRMIAQDIAAAFSLLE